MVISAPCWLLSAHTLRVPPSLGLGPHFIGSQMPSVFCTSSDTASSQSLQSPATGSDPFPLETPTTVVPIPCLSQHLGPFLHICFFPFHLQDQLVMGKGGRYNDLGAASDQDALTGQHSRSSPGSGLGSSCRRESKAKRAWTSQAVGLLVKQECAEPRSSLLTPGY